MKWKMKITFSNQVIIELICESLQLNENNNKFEKEGTQSKEQASMNN